MERRQHSHHGGGASPATGGGGVPDMFNLQRMYWAVVGAVIAAATIANIMNKVMAAQRLVMDEVSWLWMSSGANLWTRFSDRTLTPSKPKSIFFRVYATTTALMRESSNAAVGTLTFGNMKIRSPTLGRLSIVLGNLVVLMVLCFYKLDTMDQWSWEDIGYRTGFIAIAQLPLIFLLAAKNNFIGILAGTSYERLNWLHRWVARTLWLTTTIHMCFWFRSWGRYNYILKKLTTDKLTQTGFASWCILTFIVLTSIAPVRRMSYELFVVSHVLTFVGFIAAIWFHAPAEVKAWVWIPIGLLIFDRAVRYAFMVVTNLRLVSQRKKATFTPLPGNVTRITISEPSISWKPGQHIMLSCHSLLPLQSHPFTIASISSDRKLEFLVRAEKGGTKKLFNYASLHSSALGQTGAQSQIDIVKFVTIDGPYGRIRPLRQFDSVVFIAGSMGATFTMPLMRDIVEGWKHEYLEPKTSLSKAWFCPGFSLTKRIRFVWIVRARSQLTWFIAQLEALLRDMDDCADMSSLFSETRQLEISIYLTCDPELSSGATSPPSLPTTTAINEEKEQLKITTVTSPDATTIPSKTSPCSPRPDCCCTRKVTDETAPSAPCMCSVAPSLSGPPTEISGKPQSSIDPRITILSGRPDTRTIIRSVLEKAEGESGVVVCGPKGLNADVRRNVVSLSDERAVHKGTGAQGIYLHVEQFGF